MEYAVVQWRQIDTILGVGFSSVPSENFAPPWSAISSDIIMSYVSTAIIIDMYNIYGDRSLVYALGAHPTTVPYLHCEGVTPLSD